MTDPKVDFAGVLAQVIPVAILAVVVESRSAHELRARTRAPRTQVPTVKWCWRPFVMVWRHVSGQPPQQDKKQIFRDLLTEAVVLIFLVFIEMAALLTADGSETALLNWFAGRPGAIAVGVLLVLVGQLYINSLVQTYRSRRKLTLRRARKVRAVSRDLLLLTIGVAVWATIHYYV
ncbi:hypothetical protein [Streptomyces canus]|uniref:hypothetical protein n=1 Tax=Streptomyces canus TaxID=58343 RepID=UPI00278B42AC|nr:hypothetical protein [Streptomyces canus]MDQ0757369.1 hypothetical protein [Streptomyces canus]